MSRDPEETGPRWQDIIAGSYVVAGDDYAEHFIVLADGRIRSFVAGRGWKQVASPPMWWDEPDGTASSEEPVKVKEEPSSYTSHFLSRFLDAYLYCANCRARVSSGHPCTVCGSERRVSGQTLNLVEERHDVEGLVDALLTILDRGQSRDILAAALPALALVLDKLRAAWKDEHSTREVTQ